MDAFADHYPSRIAPEPSIAKRQDPVVHPSVKDAAGAGPLDRERLAAFERDGYLFFERFLPESEVAALNAEMDALWRQAATSQADEVVREPGSDEVRSIFAIHRSNAVFRRLSRDPRIAAMAGQILGSQVYVHQSRINYKKGFVGKEFYWHSDFETWHIEDGMPRMRAISVALALSDNTPVNGPLMLIRESHRHYVTCVGETPEDHYKSSLRRQEYGVPDPESLARLATQGEIAAPVGPAGSLVLFDCNTMHGSNSNITPLPRSNVFMVYNSVDNALVQPFGGTKPRPDFIASRDFTPISPE